MFPVHTTTVAAPSGDPEDFFAAQNLEAALTQSGLLISPSAGNVDLTIHLLRDTADEAKQLLAANKLSLDAPMQDEGYVLISRHTADGHSTVAIIGHTAAGIFYGAQTLKQMIAARRRRHKTLDRHHPRLARNEVPRRPRRPLPRPIPHSRLPETSA